MLPKFIDAPPWLNDHMILLAYGGSKAYGTNTPLSDTDYRGIVVPPENYFIGLPKNFESYRTPEMTDPDAVIYEIKHYIHLLTAKSGLDVIELLFTDPDDIVCIDPFGQELIDFRYEFLSKRIYKSVSGFAYSQVKRLENGGLPTHGVGNSPKKQAVIQKYGWDTGAGSHLIRVLNEGIEIIQTGELTLKRPDRQILLDIKQGKYTIKEIIDIANGLRRRLDEVYTKSILPDDIDYHKIDDFMTNLIRKYLFRKHVKAAMEVLEL